MTHPTPPGQVDTGRSAPWPASTTVGFWLLVALSVLPGVFVGNALWLHTHGALETVPLPWLLTPPLLILAGVAALTLVEPGWTIGRQGLLRSAR